MGRLRVAVIGAGPSGIVAVKELLEAGHEPVCFERSADIGGVFRFDEENGVVWDSCRLTSSGLLTAFSDFPPPPGQVGHMTIGQYAAYLDDYCEAFAVRNRIRFGTSVESVERDGDAWSVQTRDAGGPKEERVDAVAVCSGLHQHPHRPPIPGIDTFTGEVLHSAEYRRPEHVTGRRVLVVGAGESGADVIAEVAMHASETVVSLRRGVAVLPRSIRGYPNDYRTTRLSNSSAHWVFETRNPADARQRNVYRVVFFPLVVADKLVQLAARFGAHARATVRDDPATRRTARLTSDLLAESGGTLQEQFGTKSDEWVEAIAVGRCRRVGPIARIDGSRVVLEDGEELEPDVVILCTGFDAEAPFLSPEIAGASRFLHTFVPAVGPHLAFIGYLRPAFGAIPPLAELQARWFARTVDGSLALPPRAQMEESIERRRGFRTHYFRAVHDRLDYLVDFTSTCDELAAQIGCKPTRAALASESRAFRRQFDSGPFVAAQYRLVGPGAKPDLARRAIEGLPSAYPRHELAAFRLRRSLSRVLHRALGSRYAPKLELS